jgi:hypothetical protein
MTVRSPAPKRIPTTDPPLPLPPTPPVLAQRPRIRSGRYAIVNGKLEGVAPDDDREE